MSAAFPLNKQEANDGSIGDLATQNKMQGYSFLATKCCICSPKHIRNSNKLIQAEKQFKRQLDVVKFVKRQRMILLSVMAILRPEQRLLVQYMAESPMKADDDANNSDHVHDAAIENPLKEKKMNRKNAKIMRSKE